MNLITTSGPANLVHACIVLAIAGLLTALPACSSNRSVPENCARITAQNADNCLAINEIQLIGTHNSYKKNLTPELARLLDSWQQSTSKGLSYGHRPLTEQLSELGIRQFELDIFADPDGGLFAEPAGALLTGDTLFLNNSAMMEPGFKALHVQDIDYRSTCLTFVDCLREIKDWSAAHPGHLPIMILVELKEGHPQDRGGFSFTRSIPMDKQLVLSVDDEIRSVFSPDHILTPDMVRGSFETLEQAILQRGWPTVAEARGKVLFALDNTGRHRDLYLEDSDILAGRIMFVSSAPGHPSAAFIKMNNAMDDHELITERVGKGYLVRTRTDIPGQEAHSGDTTRQLRAKQSGAQFLSTDYPEPSPFGSGYIMRFEDTGMPWRCNPVSAPDGCRHAFITEP